MTRRVGSTEEGRRITDELNALEDRQLKVLVIEATVNGSTKVPQTSGVLPEDVIVQSLSATAAWLVTFDATSVTANSAGSTPTRISVFYR